MYKYILGSASPRRKELLGNMGLDFEIVVSDCDEAVTKTEPHDIVKELSLLKASDVKSKILPNEEGVIIIAADTLVFLGNERLGKPKDKEDAKAMLRRLSGNSHSVITGVTIMKSQGNVWESVTFSEETKVLFAKLDENEIDTYVNTGEPMDKAGSYAIQGIGAKFVTGIDGDYSNVVGLPVPALYKELRKRGWI
ncbi:MAG: Maf family protein [Lachnospiraceae bacterium]|nr:Maf family protein [Lachnospiraceae bacterium]